MNFNLIDHIHRKDDFSVIWLFNIGAEKFWSINSSGVIDIKEETTVNHCEEMNLLIAQKNDYFILRQQPDEAFIRHIKNLTGCTPNILVPDVKDESRSISELVLDSPSLLAKLKSIAGEKVRFVPYGVTALEEEISQKCNLHLIGACSELNKRINSKVFSREVALELGCKTTNALVCNSIDEIREGYNVLKKSFNKIIIKEPNGASGKGLYVVECEKKLETILVILKRNSMRTKQSTWLVEGWVDNKKDLNMQIYVDESGNVDVFSIKEQLVNGTVYIGSVMPPRFSEKIIEECIFWGEKIGKHLAADGFNGILGVDALIDGSETLIPIIEISARFTLSTYISFLPFDKMKLIAFYKRFVFEDSLDFNIFSKKLSEHDIHICSPNQEGAFVYTSETINDKSMNGRGRLFCISAAETYERAEKIRENVISIIDKE